MNVNTERQLKVGLHALFIQIFSLSAPHSNQVLAIRRGSLVLVRLIFPRTVKREKKQPLEFVLIAAFHWATSINTPKQLLHSFLLEWGIRSGTASDPQRRRASSHN